MTPCSDLISSSKAGEDDRKAQLFCFFQNIVDKIGLVSGIDITE